MYTGYAKELTKEYLIERGITYVSPLGTYILRKNKYTGEEYKMSYYENNSGYYVVRLYETDRRMQVPKEERKTSTGNFYTPVHRIIYAWFYGVAHEGMVIDHINNNKKDNNLYNLQELTPAQNLNKNKVRRVIKCKLELPREVYETKYNAYNELYQKAKEDKDSEGQHKYRTLRAYWEAKLAYYDQHKMVEQFLMDGENNEKKMDDR